MLYKTCFAYYKAFFQLTFQIKLVLIFFLSFEPSVKGVFSFCLFLSGFILNDQRRQVDYKFSLRIGKDWQNLVHDLDRMRLKFPRVSYVTLKDV